MYHIYLIIVVIVYICVVMDVEIVESVELWICCRIYGWQMHHTFIECIDKTKYTHNSKNHSVSNACELQHTIHNSLENNIRKKSVTLASFFLNHRQKTFWLVRRIFESKLITVIIVTHICYSLSIDQTRNDNFYENNFIEFLSSVWRI